ncbi:MAG: arylsulfotransferase family protein [Gemmatimonadales bacterium]
MTVAQGPINVLSASVGVYASNAESARVLFAAPGAPLDSTPSVLLAGGFGTVPVLGLRTGATYRGVVEVTGGGTRVQSDSVSFSGGDLPEPLRHVSFTTTGTASRGFTIAPVAVGGFLYGIAFDSTGAIRWYRGFGFDGAKATGDFKQQENGNFTLYIGTSTGWESVPGQYVEFSPAGDSLRSLSAPAPFSTDNHELLITGSGGDERIHLFGYDRSAADLSAIGGPSSAEITGHHLLRLRPDGSTDFSWGARDHIPVEHWIEPPRPDPTNPAQPDYDHPNGIALDLDGNYIVSWRNLGQVIKLDAQTGEVLWRLGGVDNEFTFVNDPLDGFSAQHYAHILPNAHLLLYDNGTRHTPQQTRVVEYALDTSAHTATLVWEFRHSPPIYTAYVGSVQRLANGNTAIGYGFVGHATEVTPAGAARWEADLRVDGKPTLAYRMVRIASLYGYETP